MSGITAPPPASSRLVIFDTTLRDGEQSPGVSLDAAAKIRIGRALAELGVDVCEIGFPACAVDLTTIQSLVTELGHYVPAASGHSHPMTLAVLARCVKSDVDIAWHTIHSAARPRLHLFYATSDIHLEYKLKKTREQALHAIAENVSYARSLCEDVEWSAEDASRTSIEFLAQAVIAAIRAGATTINLPDTVGSAVPHEFMAFISAVRARVAAEVPRDLFTGVTFSTHCHNDLGLATANTISAIAAGCRQVEVTVNGIGERAGNTAMEEVVMSAELHPNSFGASQPLTHGIQTKLIVPTSQLVSLLTGMAVQRNKAIVGANCCLHESGVHVDGILKNRATYEIFPASKVGWDLSNNGIVLGKHSGRAAYKGKLNELGVQFSDEAHLNAAFSRFQSLISQLTGNTEGAALTPEQLLSTVNHDVNQREEEERKEKGTADTLPESRPTNANPDSDSGDLIIELLGDGISDEVTREGRRILEAVAPLIGRQFRFEQHPIGGRAIDLAGEPLPATTLEACKRSKAVLLGAVGDPKFNDPNLKVRPEQGLLAIRSALELYQNLRPVVVFPSLIDASPFRREVVEGTDVMIVRELTGGIYNNVHNEGTADASDVMYYTVEEIERIVRAAANIARGRKKKLVSLDKANVLACSRLWRNTVTRLMRDEFPDIAYEHQLIDSAAMSLIKNPRYFDVIVTENLFGDILSDEAAALASSLGMMGSASLSVPGKPGLFEPVHGSAPDIAGKGIANPIGTILSVAMMLRYAFNEHAAAAAVDEAIKQVVAEGIVTPDIAKKGVQPASTSEVGAKIAERAVAILQSTRAVARNPSLSRRPMTLPEKILCQQAIGLTKPEVSPGDWIVCKVARTLASEMTWLGMSETWESMGQPPLWRKDRFFLAIDHTVDPSNYEAPFQSKLISAAEGFAKSIDLVDYFAPNQSILHTEFYRQRALPGTVICGADSHSCSAGCLGAFAAGLGAADVVMPTVTGQTFLQVPETLLIHFTSDLPFGMTGKDVMLYIMQRLKRNTVAFERAVEFSGSIRSMSIDSRFALANMTTEFGGIAGIFPSDEVTASFLAGRKRNRANNADGVNANKAPATIQLEQESEKDEGEPLFFEADSDAQYAERYDFDLSQVTPLIAKYPSPDNVYAIDDPEIDRVVPEVGRSIRELDGCFIGACTTTEEELILGALVLEAVMADGVKPVPQGTRKVTAGSAIMTRKLERLGLLDIYRRAGYAIGAPGCSYCIAVAVDVAPKGSVWLSSQNRNFRNRMGPGSIGNLASAATVAVSSLFMRITDPRPWLAKVDRQRFETMLEREPIPAHVPRNEPNPELANEDSTDQAAAAISVSAPDRPSYLPSHIEGRVQRFEDNIDTDAIIPAQLMLDRPLSKLAKHSFKYVRPEFVDRVNEGRTIIVAGNGFGSGSSREEAVSCLRAAGVKAVIAKGYAYIFGRNLLCLDLLGIIITDDAFYELAQENEHVEIDVDNEVVRIAGREFPFTLSPIQRQIYRQGGVIQMYREAGPQLFRQLADVAKQGSKGGCGGGGGGCRTGSGSNVSAAHADLAPSAAPVTATKSAEW